MSWILKYGFLILLSMTITACQLFGGGVTSGTRTVDVLWVAENASSFDNAGTLPVTISLKPSASKQLAVGVSETTPTGSGLQWQASSWMSVVTSGFLLGKSLSNSNISFEVKGKIDGPSAGGMMAVGVLSLLRNDRIKRDVAMTGTINPDGSIGPVGGIDKKLFGAHKNGKKLVLIPQGQMSREVLDAKQQLGINVQEVADIYDAYKILTGKNLPKPFSRANYSVSLSEQTTDKLKAKVREWQAQAQETITHYKALGTAEPISQRFAALGGEAFSSSETSLNQNNVSKAYAEAQESLLLATLASEIVKNGVALSTQGTGGMQKNLEILYDATAHKIDGLLSQLKSHQVKSAADAITMINAYGNLSIAIGLIRHLKLALQNESINAEDGLNKVGLAIITQVLADIQVKVAKDSLEMGFNEGKGTKPNSKLLGDYANLTEQAAQVNLNYFEAIFINPIADDKNVSANSVKQIFQSQDSDYAFAKAALDAIPDISEKVSRLPAVEKQKGPEDAALYAKLGASLASYQLSAGLIAKYYSLGAHFDSVSRQVTRVDRESSLVKMLASAETKARDLLSLSDASGNNSSLLKIGFEQAAFDREGDVGSKIKALQGFWDVGLKAELTSIFANKFNLK